MGPGAPALPPFLALKRRWLGIHQAALSEETGVHLNTVESVESFVTDIMNGTPPSAPLTPRGNLSSAPPPPSPASRVQPPPSSSPSLLWTRLRDSAPRTGRMLSSASSC